MFSHNLKRVRGDGGKGGPEAGPDLSGAAGDLARPLRRRGEKGPASSRDVRDGGDQDPPQTDHRVFSGHLPPLYKRGTSGEVRKRLL